MYFLRNGGLPMNKLKTTTDKKILFVLLFSGVLLIGSHTASCANQTTESASRHTPSPIESTLKKTVNFLTWPIRKTLEFKDKVLGADKEKALLKNQINSKKNALKELESQLSSYVPQGKVERCAKLLLKKENFLRREKHLNVILNNKKNTLKEIQNTLALLQTTPSSLRTKLAHGGGIIGGALVGYTAVKFISDRLFESGDAQLAELLKEQLIIVQKVQALKAELNQLSEEKTQKEAALHALTTPTIPAPAQATPTVATPDAVQTTDQISVQKTELEQALARIQETITQKTDALQSLKDAHERLNEKIITPHHSSTLVSIIKVCAPWVGAALGGFIGYRIADKFFVPIARTLSAAEQEKVIELQKALNDAQKAFDIISGKYNGVAGTVQLLDNLPNNVQSALSDYLMLKEQIKETEEYLTKSDFAEILGL